jgi:predicted metal-binding membrane protein
MEQRVTRREPVRLAIVAALLGVAALGWAVLGRRMVGMDDGPGTDPGALGFVLVTWVAMTGAMMLPSAAPMVAVYERVRARRRALGRSAPASATAFFVGGYLLAWAAFGLAGWLVVEAGRALASDALGWGSGGRYVAGAVIALGAAYELTPLKQACLRRCRGPLEFLAARWHDGAGGGLRLGTEHGAWCVGCCWALMAALFALGVMSLTWMALVALLIAAEKLLPFPRAVSLAIAALLAALGIAVAVVPEHVPGLVVPGSGAQTA